MRPALRSSTWTSEGNDVALVHEESISSRTEAIDASRSFQYQVCVMGVVAADMSTSRVVCSERESGLCLLTCAPWALYELHRSSDSPARDLIDGLGGPLNELVAIGWLQGVDGIISRPPAPATGAARSAALLTSTRSHMRVPFDHLGGAHSVILSNTYTVRAGMSPESR